MSLILMQIIAAVLGLLMLALWPPASGRMTIVPIDGSDANGVMVGALAGGGRVLGAGPLPRSLVVVGDRAAIAARFGTGRVLILAPAPAGCGSASGEDAT